MVYLKQKMFVIRKNQINIDGGIDYFLYNLW